MKKVNTLIILLIIATFPYANGQNPKTSWLGNTFGFGDQKWVQNHINSFYVTQDGTCFTQSIWDEGHNESSIYKDGDKIGKLTVQGGLAVGGDGTYVYTANGNASASEIVKSDISGKRLKFTTPKGGSIKPPDNTKVYAITAYRNELFISDPNNGLILVYDATTGEKKKDFKVTRPSEMVMDSTGNLWITQSAYSFAGEIPIPNPYIEPAKIVCYSRAGEKLAPEITDIVDPSGMAIDKDNRLLVCESGTDLQVRCYKNISTKPELDSSFYNNGTFGRKGGISTGVPGYLAPDKLYNLQGVGTDKDGNLYVCLSGPHPKGDGPNSDAEIRKYDIQGKMLWQIYGKEFVDMGDLDPASDTAFYTKESRYTMDWNKTVPGTEATYAAYTLNKFKYPEDLRAPAPGAGLRDGLATVFARRIDGQLFLYCIDQAGDQGPMKIFRFDRQNDGEIAIPCERIGKSNGGIYPPNQPTESKEYIWSDKNKDGKHDADEFTINPVDEYPYCTSLWPDSNGNIWRTYRERGIRKITCKGLDVNGIPSYSFEPREYWKMPEPFTDVHHLRYIPETDVMYMTGWTSNIPAPNGDKPSQVHSIARFDNWSTNPKLVWTTNPVTFKILTNCESIEVAGDYIFAVRSTAPTIYVFRTSDGELIQGWDAGPEVGSAGGWIDIWDGGFKVHKRSNGEYLIFVEEDWHAKSIIYRWTPPAGNLPSASVTAPKPVDRIAEGSTVELKVDAKVEGGSIKKVDFIVDNKSIETDDDGSDGWTVKYQFKLEKNYKINAIVQDNNGNYVVTKDLNIYILGKSGPYLGKTYKLPGTIEAINFDGGGEGIAYHDQDAINPYHEYRNEGVDINLSKSTGNYYVTDILEGEWLNYTVVTDSAGIFDFNLRYSTNSADASFVVKVNENDRTRIIKLPDNKGFENWSSIMVKGVRLEKGEQTIKFECVKGTIHLERINVGAFSKGTIFVKYWLQIEGTSVSNLIGIPRFPDNPSKEDVLTKLEIPSNWADNYGTFIQGYIIPPLTGLYTFWIASDDNSEFWLSPGENPGDKEMRAFVSSWTDPRKWDIYPEQKTADIALEANKKYYFEALQKEGSGGDNLSVAWQGPGIPEQQVVDGKYLAPYLNQVIVQALSPEGIAQNHLSEGMSISAYPNPIKSYLTISYNLIKSQNVKIEILDINGRTVNVLKNGFSFSGKHEINWNVLNSSRQLIGNGTFFLRFINENNAITQKLIIVK